MSHTKGEEYAAISKSRTFRNFSRHPTDRSQTYSIESISTVFERPKSIKAFSLASYISAKKARYTTYREIATPPHFPSLELLFTKLGPSSLRKLYEISTSQISLAMLYVTFKKNESNGFTPSQLWNYGQDIFCGILATRFTKIMSINIR